MRNDLTTDQKDRMASVFRCVGIKGEFARAAKREMKLTPEYEQAKQEGRAREWLESEAASFAESAWMLLEQRLEDLDP